MRTFKKFSLLPLLLFWLTLSACAVDLGRQAVSEPGKLPGTFTVVLVGGNFGTDAERMAILDVSGDDYSFRPVTGAGRVRKVEGLNARDALAEAVRLFSGHCAYNGYQVKSLALATGQIVGYQVIPDYPTALCESGNTLSVSYTVGKEGEIKVYTSLLLPVDKDSSFGSGKIREKSIR